MQFINYHLQRVVGHLWLFILLVVAVAVADAPAEEVNFDRDIRPILSDKCFQCHGPDAESRAADLRLDTHAGATEFAVVPGSPDDSELVSRILSDDEDYRMPPPSSHLTLSNEQKNQLQQWISEGAEYSAHWAFQALPERVPVPSLRNSRWPRTKLDRFVFARLERASIDPSPPAAPLRLLRRLSFDLTGLPPTADEIRSFEKEARIDRDSAISNAVDRLLSSSAYGEHMAVAWLDAARYADSFGYQSDQLNTQWPYRDWVVQAFNQNLPYDKFITWQLAGDLLPNATTEQILATAFNRIHRMTNEGGSIAEEWLVENASDRVHTFGTAMLGLTLECSRCHDHKYDPIGQRDYYSLSAFFNSIDENGLYDRSDKVPSPSLLLPTDEQRSDLTAATAAVRLAERELASTIRDGNERFQQWISGPHQSLIQSAELPDLTTHVTFEEELYENEKKSSQGNDIKIATHAKRVPGFAGQAVRFDGDHGVVLTDVFHIDRWDTFSLDFSIRDTVRNPSPVVVLHRTRGMEVGYNGFDVVLEGGIVNVRLYRVWPGNAIGIRSLEPIAADQWQHLAITYDGSSSAAGLRLYLDGQECQTEVVRDHVVKSVAQVGNGDGYFTLGERFRDRGFRNGEMDELRIFERALTPLDVAQLHDGRSLKAALKDSVNHMEDIREFFFSAVDSRARQQLSKLREARKTLVDTEEPIQEVSVMDELDRPRPTYVLARGAYDASKSENCRVGRDVFREILPPFPEDAPKNRLGLAQWMIDPSHPLTARVFVNRIWMNFFGHGLVATPENFGRQGEAPTNPELLDWLARDFVDHAWDIKHLCRQIVLSATYQQDSRLRPELRTRDPENRLLARGPSGRLAAEQIRDLALASSGLLVSQTGGPPVSPYQPGEDLWRESNDMSPPFKQSTAQGLHRRSLYSVWKRTAPLPNMLSFDTPTREVCVVSRSRTNTPLQALVLLNDVQFVEAARVLAADVTRCCDTTEARICEAFLRLTGRHPDAVEVEELCNLYREQVRVFTEADVDDPKQLLQVGESPTESELSPVDLAALTVTCQAILNLDATIYDR
jgi:hypothetical protein